MRLSKLFLLLFSLSIGFFVLCGDDDSVPQGQSASTTITTFETTTTTLATTTTSTTVTYIMMTTGEVYIPPAKSGSVEVELQTTSGTEKFILMVYGDSDATRKTHYYTVTSVAGSGDVKKVRKTRTVKKDYESKDRDIDKKMIACGTDISSFRKAADFIHKNTDNPIIDMPMRSTRLPVVGSHQDIDIYNGSTVVTVDTECIHVGQNVAFWIDRTNHPTDSISLDLNIMSTRFDETILPRLRTVFGNESDVNSDGGVNFLFTTLTDPHSQGINGYFNPYDLYTGTHTPPPDSQANGQEILYLLPPWEASGHMGSTSSYLELIAHEFQHSIYFYRKYLLHDNVDGEENVYITEGMSALAEDISGFGTGTYFTTLAALNSPDDLSVNDMIRSITGYITDRDGVLRGGVHLFFRYLYDQYGGDVLDGSGLIESTSGGAQFIRQLVDSAELGVANLESITGSNTEDIAFNWYIAMMVDDRVDDGGNPLNTGPKYNYLEPTTDPISGRERGTTMFDSYMGVDKTGPVIRPIDSSDGIIRAGGVEYISFTALESGFTTVKVEPNNFGPINFRIAIFRTK